MIGSLPHMSGFLLGRLFEDAAERAEGFGRRVPTVLGALNIYGELGAVKLKDEPLRFLTRGLDCPGLGQQLFYQAPPNLVTAQDHGHRVRLATHSNFKEFMLSAGLEFFPLGGDPKVLAQAPITVDTDQQAPMGSAEVAETKTDVTEHSSEYMMADSESREVTREKYEDVCDQGTSHQADPLSSTSLAQLKSLLDDPRRHLEHYVDDSINEL
ncbi:Sterol 3-beta-glucosyltransferase UGT80A2 [Platanthera guangdongensis]|uniref:Sterol 3-beta-glucosyltransferase UGT80A2 n=1 Tax=Platanthera guangdongensis TaxID=2320717 RepID=A0ABR2LJQ8_9ASPA